MTAGDTFDLETGAHLSGSTTAVIIRWVRGQFGDEGVLRLLTEARETRPCSQLENVEEWSSYRQATSLLEAAVVVTGRPDAARRIGEEMLTQHRGTAVVELLRSLGSPEALLESIAQSGAKFSTVFTLAPREVTAGHAVVVGSTPTGVPRHRLLCDFTQGLLSIIPTVFGLAPALVMQSECQARGATRCVYTLSWGTDPLVGQTEEQAQIQRLESRLDAVQMQLDSLRATSSEVAATDDVSTSLDLLTRRAGTSVRASRYLLAVRMPSEDRLRVHCCGMEQDEGEALAPTLLDAASTSSRLVADVASSTRRYGVLVALFPDESSFFHQEQEILASYAGHVANVLDTAWALEDARRQNETARALLDLSRSLRDVVSPSEVAQRVAAVVPSVVDCDTATVLLWDDDAQHLRLYGEVNVPSDVRKQLSEVGIAVPDTPELGKMLSRPEPLFLQRGLTDPYLQSLLERADTAGSVVVPIVGDGRFLGIVTAAVDARPERLKRSDDLVERLAGLADQCAAALTNARLLGELQRQALQDALTALPNRLALVANMEQTLVRAQQDGTECGLMFLDLDGFKQVNDRFGHLAGDALLVEVSRRLVDTARAGDTVARLGGDEFAVLLSSVDSPEAVLQTCARTHRALCVPYDLGLELGPVMIGVSIGVGFGHRGLASTTDMLRAADHAMYAAKAAGGGYRSAPPDAESGLASRRRVPTQPSADRTAPLPEA